MLSFQELDPNAVAAVLISPFVGSFLSVVVVRLPAGESVVIGRSHCRNCNQTLSVRDLLPVLSWLIAHGRCRRCGGSIGLRYPTLELSALAAAAWAATVVSGWLVWPSCILGWSLILLAAIDLEHFVLPNAITLPLVGMGLGVAWLLGHAEIWSHLGGAVGMYLAFVAVAAGYRRLRGREGLGMGDAKLAAAAGAWTSWTGAPSVVLLACAAAFLFVLWHALRGRSLGPTARIAFGPHLCIGTWLVWLYGPLGFGLA